MKFVKSVFVCAFLFLSALALAACSGADGVDGTNGADGKDAAEVNVDSLAEVIRKDISEKFMDSLGTKPYVDSIYRQLFDNTVGDKWMDSVRESLIDSLKEADYDSLYKKLYDSVYNDIYSQNISKNLLAYVSYVKNPINGAFANLYTKMYDGVVDNNGVPFTVPVSVVVRNVCSSKNGSSTECRWNKVMVKSWISGFTDTSFVTEALNPDTMIFVNPKFSFDKDALNKLKNVAKTQIEVRAYALENDREIPFFSSTEPVDINPMQIFGTELTNSKIENRMLYAVWVTPAMDSMKTILKEVAAKLPDGVLKVYQKYADDESVEESTERVAKAVFEVLQKRGIKYIENVGAGVSGGKMEYPMEVLRSKKAICSEYSFLLASVLEAIGFHTFLVYVTDHMFVGWSTEEDGNTLDFVETTMLGSSNETFLEAANTARENFQELQDAGSFENGNASLIDLTKARKLGVVPNEVP